MSLPHILTLPYWNNLARGHQSELLMVLTVAVIVLLDRHISQLIDRHTKSMNKVLRFLAFLALCTVGYAALSMGASWALKEGLAVHKGAYMAPIALGVLVLAALGAQRQKQS